MKSYRCQNPVHDGGYEFNLDENSPYECPECHLSVYMEEINGCVEGAPKSASDDNAVKDSPSKPDNQSEENIPTNKSFVKWIKEHKKILTILGVIAVIILIIVLICCNDSTQPLDDPAPKPLVISDTVDSDPITVKVFIKDKNIEFDNIPEGYKIYFNDDNSEGSLKGKAYDIGKMNVGDICTFELRQGEKECDNVKWESDPMLEINGSKLVYNKENPKFPPEIICKKTEENEKFKIIVTVTKGSADTFCLKKDGARGDVVEQSGGVFENLEPGTYKVWAKNGTEACQPQEVSLTTEKESESKVTKDNIQKILSEVSKGKMKGSEAYDILKIPLQNIILEPSVDGQSNLNQLLNNIYKEDTELKCESVVKKGDKFSVKIVKNGKK